MLGIRLEPGVANSHDASPSLDRLEPTRGYVKGNVAVISYRANRIKTDATAEELQRVLDWVHDQWAEVNVGFPSDLT